MQQGYASFAVDLYGKNVIGTDLDHCRSLMAPLNNDRSGLLMNRLKLVLETVKSLPMVDANKVIDVYNSELD